MKIKRKNLKVLIPAILAIIAILAVIAVVIRPASHDYPDIDTPKDVFGNKDSNVLLEEFSDLECPACQTAHLSFVRKIKEEFKDNISFTYYHFPISYHKYAQKAAEAAECANDQGKFWQFVDVAFSKKGQLDKNSLINIAGALDLDKDRFTACLGSGVKKQYVERDWEEGVRRGLKGTPTFYLNGREIEGPTYDKIKAAILAGLE